MAKKENEGEGKPVTREEFNNLEAFVRILAEKELRLSDNWKRFCSKFVGSAASNGKVGSVRLSILVAIAVAVISAPLFAANVPHASGDKAHWGTAAIQSDGTFTNNGDIYIADDATFGDDVSIGGTLTAAVIGGSGISTVQTFVVKDGLTVGTNATISGVSTLGVITGKVITVNGNGTVNGNLTVGTNATISGNGTITGVGTIGVLTATVFKVNGNETIAGNSTIGTNLTVSGVTAVNVFTAEVAEVDNDLTVAGSISASSNLTVTLITDVNVFTAEVAEVDNDLTVAGSANVSSNLSVTLITDVNVFTAEVAEVDNDLTVAGSQTIGSNLTVSGAAQFDSLVNLSGAPVRLTNNASLIFHEASLLKARGNSYAPEAGVITNAEPTGWFYEIRPSAISTQTIYSIDDVGNLGQFATYINVSGGSGTNITWVEGTNLITSGGAFTQGQYDVVSFRWTDCHDGTDKWVQVWSQDN